MGRAIGRNSLLLQRAAPREFCNLLAEPNRADSGVDQRRERKTLENMGATLFLRLIAKTHRD